MGSSGLEPPTSRLSGARSNHLSYEPISLSRCILSILAFDTLLGICGGDDGIRTHDPLLAGQVLSQLSYTPVVFGCSSILADPSKSNNDIFSVKTKLPRDLVSISVFGFFLFGIPDALFALLFPSGTSDFLHRKEVIQPHLPIRLPCYDLTPIIEPTFGCCLLAVSSQTSGVPNFHGLTGGVYKARERIHRGMLIRDY